MRAVVQRVSQARVVVEGRVVGEIQAGALILLGVGRGDTPEAALYLARKIANLRIFIDERADDRVDDRIDDGADDRAENAGKMNRSLLETGGPVLVVSQFTLYADTRGGRRPSYIQAAPPEVAKTLYETFVGSMRSLGVRVETGVFQAHMMVELVNDGPVTILLDSEKTI